MNTPNDNADTLRRPGRLVPLALAMAGVVALYLIARQLLHISLLFFGAVLVAILLRSVAGLIERCVPIPTRLSLALAFLVILLVIGGAAVLMGSHVSDQVTSLVQQVPQEIAALGDRLGIPNLQQRLTNQAQNLGSRSDVLGSVLGYTSGVVNAVFTLVLVVAGGIFLAADPEPYRRGCLKLLPNGVRSAGASTLDNLGRALRYWLLGQLIMMVLVGVATTGGLYLIGMPAPLALGLLAGLAEFIPVIGPILAAIPALLLAFSQGTAMLLWVGALYILIQQLEGNLVTPLVMRRTVDLPPAVTLFGLLIAGVLFGPLGVILGAPLTVLGYVVVKQLYLRETLGERVDVPGEHPPA